MRQRSADGGRPPIQEGRNSIGGGGNPSPGAKVTRTASVGYGNTGSSPSATRQNSVDRKSQMSPQQSTHKASPNQSNKKQQQQGNSSPVPVGRGGSSSNQSSLAPSSGEPSQQNSPANIFIPDEAIDRRVGAIIDEYMTNKDFTEVEESLSELPPMAIAQILLKLISKYLDAAKEPVMKSLIVLVDSLVPVFQTQGAVIETALKSFEPLLTLHDAKMDCQDVSIYRSAIGIYSLSNIHTPHFFFQKYRLQLELVVFWGRW